MSVSLETLEQLKKQLSEVKDLGMPIKSDLYTHLIEVFNRIMLHHPHDSYEKFEQISALVKQTNFKIRDPLKDEDLNQNVTVISNKQALDLIQKAKNLMQEVPDLVAKPDLRKLVPDSKCVIPNFVEHADMLQWAGVGFGEETTLLIQKSVKRLAVATGASQLKFFGKILGT